MTHPALDTVHRGVFFLAGVRTDLRITDMMTVMRAKSNKSSAQSRKEATHERIVDVAARAIRRSGYDGTGVADIMKEAGLTHGGFYAHFASRDALLAEAGDRAGAESVALAASIAAAAPAGEALQRIMEAYLSDEHLAAIETDSAPARSPASASSASWRRTCPMNTSPPSRRVARSPRWGRKCRARRRKCGMRRPTASRK